MPIVGLLTGGFDFTFVTLDGNSYADLAAAKAAGAAVITYGESIINFVIIAFFIFLWCYELLKQRKRSGCCCCSCWTYKEELLTQIKFVKKVISATLYISNLSDTFQD
jgi:large conductance mechanosensitive channel